MSDKVRRALPKLARAVCPKCGRVVGMRPDGRLRPHYGQLSAGAPGGREYHSLVRVDPATAQLSQSEHVERTP